MTVLLFWAALAAFFTFTLGKGIDPNRSVDWVALVKLAIRAGAGLCAGWLIVTAPKARLKATWPWLLPGALFVAYAVASTTWSPLRRMSLFQAGTLGSLYLTAVAVALYAPQANFSRVLRTFAVVLLLISAGLLAARVVAPDLAVMKREGVSLFHATNTAATASLGMILTVAARLGWGWLWTKRLWPVAVPLHAAVLAISSNRMALVLTLLAVAAVVFVRLGLRWQLTAAVVAAALGTSYLAVDPSLDAVDSVAESVGDFMSRGQTRGQLKKLSGREEMWTKMWASYQEAPALGHGYFVTSKTGVMHVWYKKGNFTAHNLLLQVLVTCGAVGMTLWLAGFAAVPALAAFRLLREPRLRGVAALAGLLGLWVFGWGLTNESFMGPLQPESVLYFFLYGLVVGSAAGLRKREHASPARFVEPIGAAA
ncbi:O-antigen ligase family protein [Alienimonas californiensis]|uniref:O-Antigen ligase n=1 Tax=Alienimonas californiensis TaxID=2527989 RepID=A0A517P457_9PLAN|nr:O-antigen ligase family protein [Alienimonas californiensis]QDT14133.1 O-Antigen ligase [Alienimonas californiensis]